MFSFSWKFSAQTIKSKEGFGFVVSISLFGGLSSYTVGIIVEHLPPNIILFLTVISLLSTIYFGRRLYKRAKAIKLEEEIRSLWKEFKKEPGAALLTDAKRKVEAIKLGREVTVTDKLLKHGFPIQVIDPYYQEEIDLLIAEFGPLESIKILQDKYGSDR